MFSRLRKVLPNLSLAGEVRLDEQVVTHYVGRDNEQQLRVERTHHDDPVDGVGVGGEAVALEEWDMISSPSAALSDSTE